jgi:hypothetical protein
MGYGRVLVTIYLKSADMKKYWKTIGLMALAGAALYYPVLKLYQYIATKKTSGKANASDDDDNDDGTRQKRKAFASQCRGKHLPHHRHSHNGHTPLAHN